MNPASPSDFLTTRWSMVLLAKDPAAGQDALEMLCRQYWQPLYQFALMQGLPHEDAADAVQDLFAELLESNGLARADAARGRFRSFLLACFRHRLIDAHRRENALKRGGRRHIIPMGDLTGEDHRHLLSGQSPEQAYDRRWAMTVLAESARRLRENMKADGYGKRIEVLEPFLSGSAPEISYAAAGEALGVTADRVRTWIHRLRLARARLLREVVAETVADPADVDGELRYLLSVVAG